MSTTRPRRGLAAGTRPRLAAGTILAFDVTSASGGGQRVTLSLYCSRPSLRS